MANLERRDEKDETGPISFAEKLAAQGFSQIFDQGMALMAAAAAYLDGPGRKESRHLPATQALLYATESMRLTTRLMQLASWLLLRRAVNAGDLNSDQALAEHRKIDVQRLVLFSNETALAGLPPSLMRLIGESFRLAAKIQRLDAVLNGGSNDPGLATEPAKNPIADYRETIRQAFGQT